MRECDYYGPVNEYDARRRTYPHSGKKSTARKEGYSLRKLVPLDDYCPCGEVKVDVNVPHVRENPETGQPELVNKVVGRPEKYRNCCVGKNRIKTPMRQKDQTEEDVELDEIFE